VEGKNNLFGRIKTGFEIAERVERHEGVAAYK
jgi:hypothetical protein